MKCIVILFRQAYADLIIFSSFVTIKFHSSLFYVTEKVFINFVSSGGLDKKFYCAFDFIHSLLSDLHLSPAD